MGRIESKNESFTTESLEKNSKWSNILTQIRSFNKHIFTVSLHTMASKNEQAKMALESEVLHELQN